MLRGRVRCSLPSSVAKRMFASKSAVETDMMLDPRKSLQFVGKSELGEKPVYGEQGRKLHVYCI